MNFMPNPVTTAKQQDRRFLDAAIRYARRNQGRTGTNPSVSCVLVSHEEQGAIIIGRGVTAEGGRPHAEPIALEEAGDAAKGATAYVTLEPCAHHGATPPCAQTLINAGVARVVIAITDPDRRVNGLGRQMLEDAGVEVLDLHSGHAATRAMQGYLKARKFNRPFVTLKLATTESGIIGSKSRGRVRITGADLGRHVHLLRARHDAILVGIGTILADDSDLRCRLPGLENRSPIRIVLDASAKLTESHKIVETAIESPTWVAGSNNASAEWRAMLQRNGVRFVACEISEGRIALPELMDDIAAGGIQSVMVEGGASVASGFLEQDLVDELVLSIGGAPETLEPGEKPVYSPVSVGKLPEGFVIAEDLRFGTDQYLRLIRND